MHRPVLLRIFVIWWPLALSWMFMGLEQPLVSAIISRLSDPTIHLAALGGVVFPLALLIESPIIMLLAASTALSDHRQAYRLMNRFMMTTGAIITALHALIAFTPLYDLVVVGLLKPPEVIVEPARWGLMVLLPWTWSIAYRRFNQGILIRYGDAKAVSIGTLFRLIANLLTMLVMVLLDMPGIIVATAGVSAGVLTEAIYIGLRARPLVRDKLHDADDEHLSWPAFRQFYIPLALTSVLLLGAQPIGSAALSRMPEPLLSLAVWPVLGSFIFLFRGLGFAYNEVVVSTLKSNQGTFAELRRFANLLSLILTLTLTLIAFTPLSRAYFAGVAGLEPKLASLAVSAFFLAIIWPALSTYRNLYQGVIVSNGNTRHITESVVASLLTTSTLLVTGVMLGSITGLYVGIVAFLIGNVVQVLWLLWRAQEVLRRLEARNIGVVKVATS